MKIPYEIYQQKQVEDRVSDGEISILFKESFYECMLVINPIWADHTKFDGTIVGHLDFFALSDGWNEYTSTGYHSVFFTHSDVEQYKNNDFVIQEFKNMLEKDDFVFEEVMQTSLF